MRVPKKLLVYSQACPRSGKVWQKDITSAKIVDLFVRNFMRDSWYGTHPKQEFTRHMALESILDWATADEMAGRYLSWDERYHFNGIKQRLLYENRYNEDSYVISWEEWRRQTIRVINAVVRGFRKHRYA